MPIDGIEKQKTQQAVVPIIWCHSSFPQKYWECIKRYIEFHLYKLNKKKKWQYIYIIQPNFVFCRFLCLKDGTFNNSKKTGLNNAIIDISEVWIKM